MLTKRLDVQDELIFQTLDELVPSDHLVRKLDEINWSFIYDEVNSLYSHDNGRPSIDPVILFKIMTIKIVFNIKSIRQTIKEIEVNLAYRWFLRIPMSEKVPHFSIISTNYSRRFKDNPIYETIFQRLIQQLVDKNIISKRTIDFDDLQYEIIKQPSLNRQKVVLKEENLYDTLLVDLD
jgi:transposase